MKYVKIVVVLLAISLINGCSHNKEVNQAAKRLVKNTASKVTNKMTLVSSTIVDSKAAYEKTHQPGDDLMTTSSKVTKELINNEINDFQEIARDAEVVYKDGIKPATASAWEKSKPVLDEKLQETKELGKAGWERSKEYTQKSQDSVISTWKNSKPVLNEKLQKTQKLGKTGWEKTKEYLESLK